MQDFEAYIDEAVERAILGYLAERPYGGDSLRGIAEWWIMQFTVRLGVESVSRALARLTDEGYLERIDRGSEPIYRLKTMSGEMSPSEPAKGD